MVIYYMLKIYAKDRQLFHPFPPPLLNSGFNTFSRARMTAILKLILGCCLFGLQDWVYKTHGAGQDLFLAVRILSLFLIIIVAVCEWRICGGGYMCVKGACVTIKRQAWSWFSPSAVGSEDGTWVTRLAQGDSISCWAIIRIDSLVLYVSDLHKFCHVYCHRTKAV